MKNVFLFMLRFIFAVLTVFALCSCAHQFDKTNIQGGQRVPAQGFSFNVPEHGNWFAVQYGNSHRIHISQLNNDDAFKIIVEVTYGPVTGMYRNTLELQNAVKRTHRFNLEKGFQERLFNIEDAPNYGDLCVRWVSSGENWLGRNSAGPALIESVGLTCAHQTLNNVLVKIELTRRHERDADAVDITKMADELFRSVEYSD